jgi:hypothetical protein
LAISLGPLTIGDKGTIMLQNARDHPFDNSLTHPQDVNPHQNTIIVMVTLPHPHHNAIYGNGGTSPYILHLPSTGWN